MNQNPTSTPLSKTETASDGSYRVEKRRSSVPYFGAAAVFLLFAVTGGLYQMGQYIFCAIVAAIVFAILHSKFPDKEIKVPVPYVPTLTGLADVDRMITDAAAHLRSAAESRAALTRPEDASLAADSDALIDCGRRILDRLAGDPSQAQLVRRLLNYYIPTFDKLLRSYLDFRAGKTGEQTMEEIRGAVKAMDGVFQKQYQKLYANMELDVSTDIDTLESMLSGEGLNRLHPTDAADDSERPSGEA